MTARKTTKGKAGKSTKSVASNVKTKQSEARMNAKLDPETTTPKQTTCKKIPKTVVVNS
jgi:hypothetical protein